MKKRFSSFLFGLSSLVVVTSFAQKDNVGIGTTKPDQSAILDLNSTNKGLLMPRLSLQQRSTIQNPAQGLVVYQTDFLSGFYFYDGKAWKSLTSETNASSVADDPLNWSKTGNIASATDFIGTTNNQPLSVKVFGQKAGLVDHNTGNVFWGYRAGNSSTGGDNLAAGNLALEANIGGNKNVALGSETLKSNTSGVKNVAVGFKALFNNNGTSNMGLGESALFSNTSGGFNAAIGSGALYTNQSGSDNIAVGAGALYLSTGNGNVGVGTNAGGSVTGGSNNTVIGYNSGRNKDGSGNIYIGNDAGRSVSAVSESNTLYIANSNTVTPLVYGDFSAKYVAVGELSVADRAAATSGGYRLLVKGGMITEKIKVATATTLDWSDYVFEEDYKKMSLESVEAYVKENKHLPNVPSTEEMMKNGNDLGKTDAKLLEKIEELTLYMIEMNKEIKALKAENERLKK